MFVLSKSIYNPTAAQGALLGNARSIWRYHADCIPAPWAPYLPVQWLAIMSFKVFKAARGLCYARFR